MIDDFSELKKRLAELSSIINSFKSEAVQLKILESVLPGLTSAAEEQSDIESGDAGRPRKRGKSDSRPSKRDRTGKKGRQPARVGPASILTELIGEGYFKSKRTISDIIGYSKHHKARKFKANELSGPLARFVRDKRLSRETNADGQFAYFKK